jgi:hypothetical protein
MSFRDLKFQLTLSYLMFFFFLFFISVGVLLIILKNEAMAYIESSLYETSS